MLYLFALLQLAVYLFLAPLMRLHFFESELGVDYAFGLALVFVLAFVLGAKWAGKSGLFASPGIRLPPAEFTGIGQVAIATWAGLYVAVVVTYGLSDRRIGTELAAELFAAIPPLVTIFFRSFEVVLPYLIAVITLRYLAVGRLTVGECVVLLAMLGAFAMSGAANSRSQTAFEVMAIVAIVQNSISRPRLLRLFVALVALASVVMVLVTANRVATSDDVSVEDYVSHEILKRLDGLELLSRIVDSHGIEVLGVNPTAASIPLLAGIPFLARAQSLKAEAMTNVKAVILDEELDSSGRDTNSFVLVDSYYCGGLLGMVSVGLLLGASTRLVDRCIGRTKRRGIQLLLAALALNLVALEREAIGIGVAVLRDWVILSAVAQLVLRFDAGVRRQAKA